MEARPGMFVMVAGLLFVALLAAALVPLMVKIVVDAQLRIGNGDVPIVRFFDAHRWHVTYAFWALFAAGLAVAMPAMIRDGFFAPETAGARPPAGAQPPLEYQIAVTPRIVLTDTRIEGDRVSYDVRETWRQVAYQAPGEQRPVTPDISTWKLLGYAPRAGQAVLLFLAPRSDGAEDARELLPVTDGRVTYAPADASVTRVLTLDEMKRIVVANPLGKTD